MDSKELKVELEPVIYGANGRGPAKLLRGKRKMTLADTVLGSITHCSTQMPSTSLDI